MALTGRFVTHHGVVLEEAYFRPELTGPLRRPLVTVQVYASAGACRAGAPPVVQIPVGWVEIDPSQPTAPQIYPAVKARLPGLADDL